MSEQRRERSGQRQRPCTQCREPTSLETVGPVSGEEKELTVTLRDLPVLVCRNGHRQFRHAKAAAHELLRATDMHAPKLPVGTDKGVLFKRLVCVDCGAPLPAKAGRPHTFRLDVAPLEGPKFGIDLTLPALRCTACGKQQLQSLREVRGRSPAALLSALRTAGIESV